MYCKVSWRVKNLDQNSYSVSSISPFSITLQDNHINADNRSTEMSEFYALGYNETTGYLARASVNKILQGGAFSTHEDYTNGTQIHDEICKIT